MQKLVKKLGIREVRADRLRALANEEEPAAITDNRELVGIFCPVTQDWLTHVLAMNESRLEQSLRLGKNELADRSRQLRTLDDIEASLDESASGGWNPFEAVSGVVSAVMTTTGRAQADKPPKHKTIGIAELKNGKAIREAAQNNQTLAVTDRRELIGIIIPVDENFLTHVVEANLFRIQANILKGNQELRAGEGTPLDLVAKKAGLTGR